MVKLDDGGHTAQGTGRVKRAAERETGVFGVTKEQGQAHEDQRDVEEAGAVNGRGATGGRLLRVDQKQAVVSPRREQLAQKKRQV